MKSKKGIELMLTKVINLVIAVIVILILAYFIFKVFTLFNQNDKLEKMKEQLDNLEEVIKEVYAGEKCDNPCKKTVLFFPERKWFLQTFPDNDFPDGQCRGNVGCICICNTKDCDTNYIICQGFEFDINVRADYSETHLEIEAGGITSIIDDSYTEVIEFTDVVSEIIVSKENNQIFVSEVKK